MAQMSTIPVFRCKYCGKPVYFTECRTATPDPEGELLGELMRATARNPICPKCQKVYNYYASQGRSDEFIRGMLSPITINSNKNERILKQHGKG